MNEKKKEQNEKEVDEKLLSSEAEAEEAKEERNKILFIYFILCYSIPLPLPRFKYVYNLFPQFLCARCHCRHQDSFPFVFHITHTFSSFVFCQSIVNEQCVCVNLNILYMHVFP